MSEHMPKEQLPKSSRKPQPTTQAEPTTAEGSHSDLMRLQRLVGNHAVQRMMTSPEAVHQKTGLTLQAKMTVGAADDAYEREADAVASQVMAKRDVVQRSEGSEAEEEELQMKRADIQRVGEEDELQMKRADTIQRVGEEDELQMKRVDTIQRVGEEDELQMKRVDTIQRVGEEDELQMKRVDMVQRSEGAEAEEEELQMKRVDMSGSFDVEKDVESQISAKSGNGQAIPDVNRQMFESSMGHDFSGVNVHTDTQSDNLNKQLGARAFTTGSDIFFRQGEYNPASSGGQELLAHELTHVVQQGGASSVQKKADEDKK